MYKNPTKSLAENRKTITDINEIDVMSFACQTNITNFAVIVVMNCVIVLCGIYYAQLQAVDKAEMMKRVSRQFKLIMQPYYRSGKITKDEYKDIMRKAVPSVSIYVSFRI